MTVIDGVRWARRQGCRGIAHAVRAALVVAVVEAGLRTLRLRPLCARLGVRLDLGADSQGTVPSPEAAPSTEFVPDAQERAMLVAVSRVLARGPWPDTCLRRALAAGWVLRRHDPALRIGVHKSAGVVRVHAWLTADGVNLDPSGAADFAPLVTRDREAWRGRERQAAQR